MPLSLMGKYEVCWPMGRVPAGRAPNQLTESPFKYLNSQEDGKNLRNNFYSSASTLIQPTYYSKLSSNLVVPLLSIKVLRVMEKQPMREPREPQGVEYALFILILLQYQSGISLR